MKNIKIVFVLCLSFISFNVLAAEVSITSPKNGAKVKSPVKIEFAADGVEIVPAGTDKPNSGHHHLLIDRELPAFDKPMGADVKHFGGGQTETELELSAGTHTLQLILGDKDHKPHSPAIVSEKITIQVVE